MSTRGSIYAEGNSHVYEETSEPKESWGNFIGWTIYAELSRHDLLDASFKPNEFTFRFKPESPFAIEMGVSEWKVNPSDIEEIVYDDEHDLILTIQAGSPFAVRLRHKDLNMSIREVYDKKYNNLKIG